MRMTASARWMATCGVVWFCGLSNTATAQAPASKNGPVAAEGNPTTTTTSPAPSSQDEKVRAALSAEQEAEHQLALGAVRLALLRAKSRLVQNQREDAITIATRAYDAAGRLPDTSDRAGLLADLEQVVVDARDEQGSKHQDSGQDSGSRVRVKGQKVTGATPDAGDSTSDPVRDNPTAHYPSGFDVNENRAWRRDQARLDYEATADYENRTDVADHFALYAEERRLPTGVMVYPSNWKRKSARRNAESSGIMFKGEPFRGEDGEMRQTIVYDIQSLLMPAPQFFDLPTMDLRLTTRDLADRAALRSSSEIFTGYAEDLARGIPLLPYFGGLDDIRTTRSVGQKEQSDLMRIIEEVLEAQ